jgi:K+-transporting ATPase KdpF subunit
MPRACPPDGGPTDLSDQTPPPQASNDALIVWLKIAGLLVGIALFGYLMFVLTRSAR